MNAHNDPGPFPALRERNPDVRVQSAPPEASVSDYDVLLVGPDHAPSQANVWNGQSARLGEIRIARTVEGVTLDLVPAGAGCLDCMSAPPLTRQEDDPIGLQEAGSLAALAALRWIAGQPGPPTPRRLARAAQEASWKSSTLKGGPPCPRPCRT